MTEQFRELLKAPPPVSTKLAPAQLPVPGPRAAVAGVRGKESLAATARSKPALLLIVLAAGFLFLTSFAPGGGVYCAVLAFGTMSVASWLLRPVTGLRRTTRMSSRKSARRRAGRVARKRKN